MNNTDRKIFRDLKNKLIAVISRELAPDEILLLVSQVLHQHVIERKIEDFSYDFHPHYKATEWIDIRVMFPSDLFKWHNMMIRPGQDQEEDPYEAYDRAMRIL